MYTKDEVMSILLTHPNGNIEIYCFKKKFPELYQEILKINFPDEFKFSQKLYHFFHDDIELKLGLCPVCGKRCTFQTFGKGYQTHCSYVCAQLNKEVRDKIDNTCLKKFGKKSYAQTEECRTKMKQTNLERHGDENYNNREKFVKTNLEKHGVNYPMQSKEIQEKSRKTCRERYNKDFYTQTEECKQKQKNTCIKKYGFEHYNKTKESKERQANTCMKKYGAYCYSKSNEFKERQSEIQEKIRQTSQKRYGVNNYSQTTEFAKTHRKRIEYDSLTFDSSWEIIIYKFCKENNIPCEYQPDITLTYEYDGKIHYYHPDFLINGKLYEIKGDQFFEGDKMICPFNRNEYRDGIAESKHQCMINNNVIILRGQDIENLNIKLFN